jgi:hypothetical protein
LPESGPTIEDLAVWAHTFAIGALGKQLGPLHIVSSFRRKKELEEKISQQLPTSTKTRILFRESAIGVFDKARFRHETSYGGCN